MVKYLWESSNWPHFKWNQESITASFCELKKTQALLIAQSHFFMEKDVIDIFTEEACTTSEIEGDLLNRSSVRSSVARRLGVDLAGVSDRHVHGDGMVEILIDATKNFGINLTHQRLYSWQATLFPTGYSGTYKISVGSYRTGAEEMRVVSGGLEKINVHYLAPPSKRLSLEMEAFLKWWNDDSSSLDGILKAAIAHLWFITIHPFDDGNGRIARALTDMALAREEKSSTRLYSLSSQILKNRKEYYEVLEKTQKGNGDITEWILWFFSILKSSFESSEYLIKKTILISRFYKTFADRNFNERQWKVIKKLLEYLPEDFEGGLTNKKYVSMTKVSPETAKRDIKELLEQGVLLLNEGKGRSTSYRLKREF